MLAIGMNGEPLPIEHGFPVRMVVPGLYGYVSATKWITSLRVTTFAKEQAYWTPLGWSPRAPIKLASRIDVPRKSTVDPGPVVVAGVAWAQHTGISAVEVKVDQGPWRRPNSRRQVVLTPGGSGSTNGRPPPARTRLPFVPRMRKESSRLPGCAINAKRRDRLPLNQGQSPPKLVPNRGSLFPPPGPRGVLLSRHTQSLPRRPCDART